MGMEFPPGSKGFESHMGHCPLPEDLQGQHKLSQCPALKINGVHPQESHGAIGNPDSAFKGLLCRLTHSKTWHKGSGFKSVWAILWRRFID